MILKETTVGGCRLILGDSLLVLPLLREFDAIVTDPPYGIDFGNFNRTNTDSKGNRYKANKYVNGDWDNDFDLTPFASLMLGFGCSLVVWGGNYFPCLWKEPTKGIVFWHKKQPCENFSKGELAWTNIDMPAQFIDYAYYGNIEGKTNASEKMHPTQKPVRVMKECIDYTQGNTILDPFMGSGTTGVACVEMGKKFIGIELDENYYNIAVKRITEAQRQPDMFIEPPKPKQEKLL